MLETLLTSVRVRRMWHRLTATMTPEKAEVVSVLNDDGSRKSGEQIRDVSRVTPLPLPLPLLSTLHGQIMI